MINLNLPGACVTLTDGEVLSLRHLRLHHWRAALRARDAELVQEGYGMHDLAAANHRLVELHMEFVEALNPLFVEPDDTAQRDDARGL